MRCTNPLGAPDVMRGEETQLLGALRLGNLAGTGRHLVCMPGTHTKWVSVSSGVVQEFLTAPTGEIFSRCSANTACWCATSRRPSRTWRWTSNGDWPRRRGTRVRWCTRSSRRRSLRLDKQLSAEGAASWTSGLLIGADVGGALTMFDEEKNAPVLVIGAPRLTESYSLALARRGPQGRADRRRAGGACGARPNLPGAAARMTVKNVEMVAILRGLTPQRAPEVGAALVDAGFRSIEVPLNSPEPFHTIEVLVRQHRDCLVNAQLPDGANARADRRGRHPPDQGRPPDGGVAYTIDVPGYSILPGPTSGTSAACS